MTSPPRRAADRRLGAARAGSEPEHRDLPGKDAVIGFVAGAAQATGGTLRMTVHRVLDDGDWSVALATYTATRETPEGQAALENNLAHVARLRDGQVAESGCTAGTSTRSTSSGARRDEPLRRDPRRAQRPRGHRGRRARLDPRPGVAPAVTAMTNPDGRATVGQRIVETMRFAGATFTTPTEIVEATGTSAAFTGGSSTVRVEGRRSVEPAETGTRVTIEVEIRFVGLGAPLTRLPAPSYRRRHGQDLDRLAALLAHRAGQVNRYYD